MSKEPLWMPVYWADYLKDTNDLSPSEHGIYFLLIAHYWQTQKILPIESEKLIRITRVISQEDRQSLNQILDRFFVKKSTGFYHKRIEKEIQKAKDFSKKQQANAKQGWDKRRDATAMPRHMPDAMPEGMPNACLLQLHDLPTVDQQPQDLPTVDLQSQPQPPQTPPGENGRGRSQFFKISNRGIEMGEDEWIFRCFLERRRSKKLSVEGCNTLEALVTLYPTHYEQYRRWLTQPIDIRMAAYAYTVVEGGQIDDQFKYAQKVAEEGQTWEKFPQFLQISRQGLERGDLEVKIND